MRVSHDILAALFAYGDAKGLTEGAIFEAAGLPVRVPHRDDERVPAELLYGVHRGLDRLIGEDDWALDVPRALPKGAYGLAEYLFRCQRTLLDAFRAMLKYFSLLSEITRLTLHVEPAGARFEAVHVDPQIINTRVERTLYQHLVSGILHVAREVTSAELGPLSVELPFSRPAKSRKYEKVFGCEVRFDAPRVALHFDDRALAHEVRAADPNLYRILARHADDLLNERAAQDDFVSTVERAILEQLHGGDPSLETIARALSVSSRSLQRKLGESGMTFKELLADARYHMAQRCLREPKFSVDQIAFLLGYSDTSAFVKAFKRWAEMTPGEYRKQHAGEPPSPLN